MVVSSAWIVFRVEYRRFVRTRRAWVFILSILVVGWLLAFGVWLLARSAPLAAQQLLGLSYMPAGLIGCLAGLPSLFAGVLGLRMVQDVYKTHLLPDLYLTELHPLGVLIGRALATTALAGVSLLTLTPAALWLCALIGVSPWLWVGTVLLALASYGFGFSYDAFSLREAQLAPLIEATPLIGRTSRTLSLLGTWVFLAWMLFGLGAILVPEAHRLAGLPVWAFFAFTAPMLLWYGNWGAVLLGLVLTLGATMVLLVGAAQWRGWWSDTAYRWTRIVGTVWWTALIVLTVAPLATMTRSAAAVEHLLLASMLGVALLNLWIAPALGYYGVGRRPRAVRGALPYPWGGVVWQWGLQWLTTVTLYGVVGWASGYWVAWERWGFWAVYTWLGVTVLAQVLTVDYLRNAAFWHPQKESLLGQRWLQTHTQHVWYESLAQTVGSGITALFTFLGVLLGLRFLLRSLDAMLGGVPLLLILADWFPRLHPWWGFYQEWRGIGDNWLYVVYLILLTPMLWGRLLRWRSFKKAGEPREPSGAGQGGDA
ncbi:MAG: hypothetical protein KatS3mg016_1074 [Fimbriimonadales bacterium]|nr:MAG: hypothetical protein KatS3mg016_1074 [Fimbriimonadales bacterium]